MKVADVMTREVISVAPETSLRDVARLLVDHQISGVPVVDAEGTCIGVVSEADLLLKQVSRRQPMRLSLEWFLSAPPDPEELRRRTAVTAAEAMTCTGPDDRGRSAASHGRGAHGRSKRESTTRRVGIGTRGDHHAGGPRTRIPGLR